MAKRSKKKKAAGGAISAKVSTAKASVPPTTLWLNQDSFWALLLVLAVILAYSPVWWAGYIWDDDFHLTANPVIIGPQGLLDIWTTSIVKFCPFVFTTFWMEHALWGVAPMPYHVVNVLFHASSAVLLWRVLRRLEISGAWLGAALWALHPVQVESVAWISEMKNTESGVFFLLTILFFVRWLKARETEGQNGAGWDYRLTLLFAFLAMASKSSTVILPIALGLCACWVEGRWRWRNLITIGPIFLLAVVGSALTMWTPDSDQAADFHLSQTWPERLATAGDAAWFYLGKLLWPSPLLTIYPRWQIDAGQLVAYLPLLLAIIALIVFWIKRESWSRPWFFAFAYFLAALLPVLGLIDMSYLNYSFVADHFQYLASMGPLALAGAGLTRLSAFLLPGKSSFQGILGAGLLLLLGSLSWQYARTYQNDETLWPNTVRHNPDAWPAYNNLGKALMREKRPAEAAVQFAKVTQLIPSYIVARDNLGVALTDIGQTTEAIAQIEQVLQTDPNYAPAHYNLGNAFEQAGRNDRAIEEYELAVRLKPDFAVAHNNLAAALYQAGRVQEAAAELEECLRLNPDNAAARQNLEKLQAQEKIAPAK
jgi:tetratricopeptide (TPR) repeat protein